MAPADPVFLVDAARLEPLAGHLRRLGWLDSDEALLEASPAGAGNMNCTLRLRTSRRSLILKQARPWVEKYPDIPAPPERAEMEARFYRVVEEDQGLAGLMPRLVAADAASHLLLLSDLGTASDLTTLYAGDRLAAGELDALVGFLSVLHRHPLTADGRTALKNRRMRALNHEHLFVVPLGEGAPALDAITPGLDAVARGIREDPDVVRGMERLGALYLRDGRAFLHGDYFPGSWLRTPAGVRVIDPEFCFVGEPEFDVGVMAAHLEFAGAFDAPLAEILRRYDAGPEFDEGLARGYMGVELIRRLLGVAQLPLRADLDRKGRWLELARTLVC